MTFKEGGVFNKKERRPFSVRSKEVVTKVRNIFPYKDGNYSTQLSEKQIAESFLKTQSDSPAEKETQKMDKNNANIREKQGEISSQKEADRESIFSFLPERMQRFLKTYEYKGVKPPEISAPDVPTGVFFLTADMKIPEEGKAKILEFNGTGSHLEAYPEGGQEAAARKIYQILDSLGIPISVLYTDGVNPSKDHPSLIYSNKSEAERYRVVYKKHTDSFYPCGNDMNTIQDLQSAEGGVWPEYREELIAHVDPKRFLVINPRNILKLTNNKLQMRKVFIQSGLEHFQPPSWVLNRQDVMQTVEEIITNSTTQKFILKPTETSGGLGMVPIEREDLARRIQQIFIEPFDKSSLPIGSILPVEGWLRNIDEPFLIEEYIASKPVISEKDGKSYDGTLRIAFMGIANKGKMTFVPLAGYWKLPSQPLEGEWNEESTISNVHQDNPSEKVSPEDFAPAFDSLIDAMPVVLRTIAQ